MFLQVILVGHSAGGLSVTQASHQFGKKIELAVYVAATMLRLGFWTDQDRDDVNISFPSRSDYLFQFSVPFCQLYSRHADC